jgi:predicted dienelactone hydrolase
MLLRLLLAALIASPAIAQDCTSPAVGFRIMHIQGRAVAVWYPTAAHPAEHAYSPNFSGPLAVNAPVSTVCGQRVPLVVFSHGDLGCGLQSVFFTEELARHGYIVAAPDHADASLCHIEAPAPPSSHPHQPNFFKPETWNDQTFADRRKDIEAVLDGLLGNPDFRDTIDGQRIGAAGHSLGGYTVVAMAGGWPGWLDRRLRAVLALSPYVVPFQVQKTLGEIRVPLMYQGGTLDAGITPFLAGPKGAYAAAQPPAYFVNLKRAGHFAWVNCGDEHTTASCLAKVENARLIDRYGIAFFDQHLRGVPQPVLSKKDPALADYQFRLP